MKQLTIVRRTDTTRSNHKVVMLRHSSSSLDTESSANDQPASTWDRSHLLFVIRDDLYSLAEHAVSAACSIHFMWSATHSSIPRSKQNCAKKLICRQYMLEANEESRSAHLLFVSLVLPLSTSSLVAVV